jgi:hypothetical protein
MAPFVLSSPPKLAQFIFKFRKEVGLVVVFAHGCILVREGQASQLYSTT